MGTPAASDLVRRLESHEPACVLAIGPGAGDFLTPYLNAHPECRITHLDCEGALDAAALLDALARHGRFDFVIVRGVLERIDTQNGAHLLAALRDIHTRRFCVVLEVHEGVQSWPPPDLIAMGLSHWSSGSVEETGVEIYGFDLGTYKSTPQWLNPRHWAHPEHWGKFRW
jgi:Family of unknown function (DUF6231)